MVYLIKKTNQKNHTCFSCPMVLVKVNILLINVNTLIKLKGNVPLQPLFSFCSCWYSIQHSCSPLENITFWKITQKAIHTQNQQFVLPNIPFNLTKTSWCALHLVIGYKGITIYTHHKHLSTKNLITILKMMIMKWWIDDHIC